MRVAGSAVEIQQTFQAVDGALGSCPLAYLAPDVELRCNGWTLFGPHEVASALRELTAGARDIHLQIIEGLATATWLLPTSAGSGTAVVMIDFEIFGGCVSRVVASELRVAA